MLQIIFRSLFLCYNLYKSIFFNQLTVLLTTSHCQFLAMVNILMLMSDR